jgi:hypothetical protein
LFEKQLGNRHAAIFLTAFLFSALHMQFYGFFPRFVLGVGFRGLMSTSELKNYDSVIGLLGVSLENGVVLGYSYDWMISQVGANTKGSHEFSLRYQFLAGNEGSRGRRSRSPKFGCYDNF